jgi:hypothetical protein
MLGWPHQRLGISGQVFENLIDQSGAELLTAAVHRKLGLALTSADGQTTTAALVPHEGATLRCRQFRRFLRAHKYRSPMQAARRLPIARATRPIRSMRLHAPRVAV